MKEQNKNAIKDLENYSFTLQASVRKMNYVHVKLIFYIQVSLMLAICLEKSVTFTCTCSDFTTASSRSNAL